MPTPTFVRAGVYRYRGYIIEHDPPPVPTRAWDWAWIEENGDGECSPNGVAASMEAACEDIDAVLLEEGANPGSPNSGAGGYGSHPGEEPAPESTPITPEETE